MKADHATEQAVRQVLRLYGDAIARGDLVGMLSVYTGDADTMVMGSNAPEWAVGMEQVRGLYAGVFTGNMRFALNWTRTEVFARGEVAWFGADGTITAGADMMPYRLSGVLECRDGEWKLAQFHGSMPREE